VGRRGRDDFHVVPIKSVSKNRTTWKSSLPGALEEESDDVEVVPTIALMLYLERDTNRFR